MSKINFMHHALLQAAKALKFNEIPIGAVIVESGNIIAMAHNLTITDFNPTAHAEMLVISEACKIIGAQRLTKCSIYVTLEPCPMCAQAISFARFKALYYGAYDFKGGGVENGARIFNQASCFHKPEVYGGIMEEECSAILKNFFKIKRLGSKLHD